MKYDSHADRSALDAKGITDRHLVVFKNSGMLDKALCASAADPPDAINTQQEGIITDSIIRFVSENEMNIGQHCEASTIARRKYAKISRRNTPAAYFRVRIC